MEAIPYLALSSALLALLLAGYFYTNVKAASPGNERMIFLMNEIEKGARAFLRQEYSWVSIFVAVMAILIGILIAPVASLTYIIGAVLSATAGYAGMTVATMANARTAHAAQDGPGKALPIAFRGGAVMGFSVAGVGGDKKTGQQGAVRIVWGENRLFPSTNVSETTNTQTEWLAGHGGGGSGGASVGSGQGMDASVRGGLCGGGAGGASNSTSYGGLSNGENGTDGGVRIVWGYNRSFPSTNVATGESGDI